MKQKQKRNKRQTLHKRIDISPTAFEIIVLLYLFVNLKANYIVKNIDKRFYREIIFKHRKLHNVESMNTSSKREYEWQ